VNPSLTGYVLAGGESRRMGRDKALLPWGGATLLGHALSRLREVCGAVAILGGSEERYADQGAPVVRDAMRDAGPLAALLAALEHARTEVVLLLAVDLPFVPPALLAFLAEAAADADVVAPVVEGRQEPLCAAYRTRCSAPVRTHLAAGRFKMTRFWEDVRVREVGPAELARFGDPALLLRNLNTTQDYDGALGAGS
jgi:molybdopterin-guanine dinucleotide biosynthesis protein A